MGLFSSSGKNKQDSASEDSAYYSRAEDDSAGLARARAKRANSADEPAGARRKEGRPAAVDPVLPEKKRARRRLVGAVALALAVAVGLPMLLDSEPKPIAGDIAIQIPSKDKPLSDIAPASASAAASVAAIAAADTLDKREEFIAPPPKAVAAPVAAAVAPAPVKAEPKAEPKAVQKPEPKTEAKAVEPRHADKAEAKTGDLKHADKADVKTVDLRHADKVADKAAEKSVAKVAKVEDKPAAKPAADAPPDAARALAILEGKPADASTAAPAAAKVVVQVAALGSPEKVAELQGRLKDAGIKSYTEKGTNAAGEHVIRVKVGPFSKDEADKVRAKLGKIGLSGITVAG
jgi:DedD protein